MRPAAVRAAAAWALAAALVSACVTPPRHVADYRQDAVEALGGALSETRTAEVALALRLADRVGTAYADTVVTASEQALGSVEGTFAGLDPPRPGLDPLRDRVLEDVAVAVDAVAAARLALRRDDQAAMAQARTELAQAGQRLEAAERGLR